MKRICNSCPFNYCHPESDQAQNYGCLPSSKDILDLKDKEGHNWACHSNPKRVCQGLAEHRDTTKGKLYQLPGTNIDFISWKPEDLKPILIDINS